MNARSSNDCFAGHGATRALLTAALVAVAVSLCPGRSLAQSSSGGGSGMAATTHEVSPNFKGTVGLGLIGMELGFVVPAVAGARSAWPYIVFPIVGAGGGAAAGYFLLEKGTGHPQAAVGCLVAGMALLIPSLVLTLAETAYQAEESPSAGVRSRMQSAAAAGPGLVRLSDRGLLLAPPAIGVESSMTPAEALRTGATRTRVVHAAVLSGVF
jgi:hypothetical protein